MHVHHQLVSEGRTASMQVNRMQAPQPLSAAVLRMGTLPFTEAMAPSG